MLLKGDFENYMVKIGSEIELRGKSGDIGPKLIFGVCGGGVRWPRFAHQENKIFCRPNADLYSPHG